MQSVLRPVSEQKALFVFLVLMCCVVIPVMCYATGAFPKPFVFAAPVFDCYLVVLLASLLRRLRLQWLVWVLCFFLLGGEVFCLLCYQSPYSMTVLQLILETNGREATEFLMGRGVLGQLAWSTLITVAAMLAPLLLPREGRKSRQSSTGIGSVCLFFLLLLSAFCQGYSYFRLSSRSGYGAGSKAPAYFEMLWNNRISGTPDNTAPEYLSRLAAYQRKNGYAASSAQVIEAMRLAETLAVMRSGRMPSLSDLRDAAVTCLGHGSFGEISIESIFIGFFVRSYQAHFCNDINANGRKFTSYGVSYFRYTCHFTIGTSAHYKYIFFHFYNLFLYLMYSLYT